MNALISGSFDPITFGHIDIIERASRLFDDVTVAICVNTDKKEMFSCDERKVMAELSCSHIKNAHIDVCHGLIATYSADHGIDYIVRGVRNGIDASYEIGMAQINRSLGKHPETIILPAKAELQHLSSTYARELIKYSDLESLSGVLSDNVIEYIKSKKTS